MERERCCHRRQASNDRLQSASDTFGTQRIIDEQLLCFKHVICRDPHPFMRRDFVLSHGGLETMLDRHEKNLPFFLYTSRAPGSDSMHLGHIVPFTVTKQLLLPNTEARWLQDVSDVTLVIMVTDDEKYLSRKQVYTRDEIHTFGNRNAQGILALGFDLPRKFLFCDFDFMEGSFYLNVVKISRYF